MAVNDLMMRIQLLVDSGKSSAELNRVQQSLNALTKDLTRLSQIKLNLKDQLVGLAELGTQLKQVNLGNFSTSITELEKSFGKLALPTTQLTKLRDAFQSLSLEKIQQSTSAYARDLEKVNQQLKDAKKYTLTGDNQAYNGGLLVQNSLLKRNTDEVKLANAGIITQRQQIAALNEQLKNSSALYAEQRKSQQQVSFFALNRALELDTSKSKLWTEELNKAKSSLTVAKENLKEIRNASSQLSKQKILDFGIADADKNAASIRSTIAEMQRLTLEIERQQQKLATAKKVGTPQSYTLDQGLVQNALLLGNINKQIDEQKIKTAQLTTNKLLAAQATEKEANAIKLINNQLRLDEYTKSNAIGYVGRLKEGFLELNRQATLLKATDFSGFAQPILEATSKVNQAKEAYQQLRIETQRAAIAVKSASLVEPAAYSTAIATLKQYRENVAQSAKVLADKKANLSTVKDELKLVNQEYRDFAAKLKSTQQDAKQFKLPSQKDQLAEYTRLNEELNRLSANKWLYKTFTVDPAIEQVRSLGKQIRLIGTDQQSVEFFKGGQQQILSLKEQLNNLKFGGVKGTIDLSALTNQFSQLQTGDRSLASISQRMAELRAQIKTTKPDIEGLKQTLLVDKERIVIGKESIANTQKALTDLKIASKSAKDEVLASLAPIAIQLKTLGETRISKANLTEGLLNEVSRLKKELNDIQPKGLEAIRNESNRLNTSLTDLRFGNEKGIIPAGQLEEGQRSIASLKQSIDALRVSARTIKLSDSFFTNADAPDFAKLFKSSGLEKVAAQNNQLRGSFEVSISSWKEYANQVQSWTERLREGQNQVIGLRGEVNSLKNVGDQSIRSLSESIRATRLEMQRVGTVNFNQTFRDEGVVNLLDKMNQVKKSVVDIQKVSIGQQKPILSESDSKLIENINKTISAVKQLNEAYAGLGGSYKKGTPQADTFKAAINSVKALNVEIGNTFKVNLNEASFRQRFDAAIKSLEGQSNAITIPITLKGLTEIQNQIRTLAAEKGLEKALNVDTVSASAKAIKAEIDVLKELKASKLEALKTDKLSAAEIQAHETRIKQLNDQLIAQGKIGKAYEGTSAISARLIELEGKNVSLKLQSADAAKKIAENQTVAIAKLKEQETIGKNTLNNLSQEAKEINQIIAAERNRAKIAKESERTNLLTLTGNLNTTKSSIGNRLQEIAEQQSLNAAYQSGLRLLSDFGKIVKSNASLSYSESQKTIGGLLEQLGLLKKTESSYLKQIADQRDAEKAAKSAAQTEKDLQRLKYNSAQLDAETNQNALRGSRERASALRDISSAIRANATVASLSNADQIRSGESLLAQVKRQYQQYQANEAATRNSIAAKKTTTDASLSGHYAELASLQRERVALLDIQGILQRRGANQSLLLKTESARQANLRDELRVQKQLAEISVSDKKSVFGGLGDQIKTVTTSLTALKNAARDVAGGLTLRDVGGTEVLAQRVGLTQRLRDLTKEVLSASLKLNQDRAARDTQVSVVKDLEAQVKVTKSLATATLETRRNKELEGQSSLVTAKQVLANAKEEEKAAKTLNEVALSRLNTKIAEQTVSIATAKQNVVSIESEIAKRNEAIAAIREQQAARVASVAKEIEALKISKAMTAEEQARLTARKNTLIADLEKENTARKQQVEIIKQQITSDQARQLSAAKTLDELITSSRKSNLETQRAAQSDIVNREQGIKSLQKLIELNNQKIASDKEAIKQYQSGLKEYEKGIRTSIAEANQRIASGQLSKTQLAEERQGIKALIKEQQTLSKSYIGTLNEQASNLKASLLGERERIKLLEQQAKAEVDITQKKVLTAAALKARNELSRIGGQEQSLTRQIQDTQDLAKAELQRLAALEKLGSAGQKQNFNASIKETERLVGETTRRLAELAVQSERTAAKLRTIGSTNTLDQATANVKTLKESLNALRITSGPNQGLIAPNDVVQAQNLYEQLTKARKERALLGSLSRIDAATASGKVELGDLSKQINQLREAQREMNKLNQFARGFGQGFTFALTPDQLGMAAFTTIQQALSELGRKFIEVNSQSETLIRGMNAIFGAGQGEVQFAKLTGLANTYGLALHDLSRNYLSLNASAKGTILEGAESEKIFRSLSAAMAVLGADTITTQRAFRAVSQMISKGQVYAEELKGQLAEALPGAVQLFARSMGKTTQEFLAMVKAGQVGLNELIPFFAQIQQEYGKSSVASTTYEQATNRLSNAYFLLLKNLGDTGVWKRLVSILDTMGIGLNVIASRFEKGLIDQVAELNRKQVKPIEILTKEQFDRLKSVDSLNNLDVKFTSNFTNFDAYINSIKEKFDALPKLNLGEDLVTITDIGSFKTFDEYLVKVRELNKSTEEYNATLNEEALAKQRALDKANLNETDNEILRIRNLRSTLQSFDEFKKGFNTPLLFKVLGLRSSDAEIKSYYEQEIVLKKQSIAEDEKKLPGLLAIRDIIAKTVGEGEKATNNEVKRNALTKKQLREEQNALNLRQQSYLNLASIKQSLEQRDLKNIGVSDTILTEVQSVNRLKETYDALAKARELEANIVEGNQDVSKNTTIENAEAFRKMTLDQLKQAQTVARNSNNLSVQLLIMMEMSRVQQTILDKTTASSEATRKSGSASSSVLEKTNALSTSLTGLREKGYAYAAALEKGLSYTEQMNRLLSRQKVLLADNAQENARAKLNNKDELEQAKETEKAIRRSQQESGQYFSPEKIAADSAYMAKRANFALAEENLARAKKSNDQEEKARLTEIALANLDVAKAKAISAGDVYGLKQIQEAIDKIRLLKQEVNVSALNTQKSNLNEYFKFDDTNKFDAEKSIKDFNQVFVEQLSIRQKAIDSLRDPNQKLNENDKAAYESVIESATTKLNELNNLYPLLEQAAKQAGIAIPAESKPTIPPEVLESERKKLVESLGQEITTSVALNTEEALKQNSEFVAVVSQDIWRNVYTNYIGQDNTASTPAINSATGGFIRGYGGGDRIHAMLEQGEFVLRKEAVRKLGLNNVWNLNNLNIPRSTPSVDRLSIPSFSGGGYVGSSNTINIHVPGNKPIQVSGSREQATALVNLLTRVGRAA